MSQEILGQKRLFSVKDFFIKKPIVIILKKKIRHIAGDYKLRGQQFPLEFLSGKVQIALIRGARCSQPRSFVDETARQSSNAISTFSREKNPAGIADGNGLGHERSLFHVSDCSDESRLGHSRLLLVALETCNSFLKRRVGSKKTHYTFRT